MAKVSKEFMERIYQKVNSGVTKSRYVDLYNYLKTSGMSEQEVNNYLANFQRIYETICTSITDKALAKANSGLDENTKYISVLRGIKYNLAAIAMQRLEEGRPLTFFTDTNRGPQGDLYLAMKTVPNIKNFIPGLKGVKLPQNDPKVAQIEDSYTISQFQQFVALAPNGDMQDIFHYRVTLRDYASERARELLPTDYSGPYDNDYFAAVLTTFDGLADHSAREAGITPFSREEKTPEEERRDRDYIRERAYADTKVLETALDKFEEKGSFTFSFVDGRPTGDLKEAIEGTVFDTSYNKSRAITPIIKYEQEGAYDGYEYPMGADGFKGEPATSGTFAMTCTKDELFVIFPHRENIVRDEEGPAFTDVETLARISTYYTEEEARLLAKECEDITRGRFKTPIIKATGITPMMNHYETGFTFLTGDSKTTANPVAVTTDDKVQ